MSLGDNKKIDYITNYFHQYVDLTLNKSNLITTETINLIFSINDLLEEEQNNFTHDIVFPEDYNINDYLEKYEDTTYDKEFKCNLSKIIDGDTLELDLNINNNIKKEKIRLVGINTPEQNEKGYNVSKTFLEDVCNIQDAEIYLNIDDKKNRDKYGRLLAILIVNNKNINEIMLKEGLAELEYIPPSEFNPYDWINENTKIHKYNIASGDNINTLSPYLNPEFTNIVFTAQDNYEILYPFEIYQNMIYVKLNPFSNNIRMHLLPKSYDCSDNILIFKDNLINKQLSNDYLHYDNKDYINSYYQENGSDRNRSNIETSDKNYNIDDWINTYCEFSYDISQDTKKINNLEICAGYRYNNSTPYYSIHYTGVKDNTSISIEDRCSLIDANYDNIESKTNNITQFQYTNEKTLYISKNKRLIRKQYGDIPNRLDDNMIGKLYHKKLKYINDLLYVEEKSYDNNIKYGFSNWVDISK